jgi:hypothetical protein
MAYEITVKDMVPIKALKEKFPQFDAITKNIPDNAWATINEQGQLVILLVVSSSTTIPIAELQAFKSEEQTQWSSLCMRTLLVQLDKLVDDKMSELVKPGTSTTRVIPLKRYG